jgi:hypothetical protein
MKIKIFFLLFFIISITKVVESKQLMQDFDRAVFYEIMKSGGVKEINEELVLVDASSIKEQDAYKGALLMKKAGLVKKAKDKLKFFKSGRINFETAIRSDSNKVEYHFLRLTIQEHAPKVVKYSAQLESDRKFIIKFFKNLSPVAQHAVIDYSKTSKVLHPEDF